MRFSFTLNDRASTSGCTTAYTISHLLVNVTQEIRLGLPKTKGTKAFIQYHMVRQMDLKSRGGRGKEGEKDILT